MSLKMEVNGKFEQSLRDLVRPEAWCDGKFAENEKALLLD